MRFNVFFLPFLYLFQSSVSGLRWSWALCTTNSSTNYTRCQTNVQITVLCTILLSGDFIGVFLSQLLVDNFDKNLLDILFNHWIGTYWPIHIFLITCDRIYSNISPKITVMTYDYYSNRIQISAFARSKHQKNTENVQRTITNFAETTFISRVYTLNIFAEIFRFFATLFLIENTNNCCTAATNDTTRRTCW